MKIGILTAMESEHKQIASLLTDKKSVKDQFNYIVGKLEDKDVVLCQCGIGKVNAALGAQRMINKFHPDIIISSGCAGGNGDDIQIQDVVVSAQLTYHDVYCGKAIDDTTIYGQVQGLPARYETSPELLAKATTLDCGVKIHPGLIVTGDWFVDSKEKMREIIAHFPEAKAVDMDFAIQTRPNIIISGIA